MVFHLDTDFAVYAFSWAGPERRQLLEVAEADRTIEMSAVAWYEFARGPRQPEQLAAARAFLGASGVVPLSDEIATLRQPSSESWARHADALRTSPLASLLCSPTPPSLRGTQPISRTSPDWRCWMSARFP